MRPTSKGQPWGRKELILTLDLYKDLKGHIPDLRDPEIIALSSVLSELALMQGDAESSGGRSRAAIIFKMSNFRSLDPQARDKGKTGLANVGSLDRAIWNEFLRDPTKLRREAKSIRAEIRAGRKEIQPLRANLHILRLLGDELIGSPQLAIFELVKNAYDADAENAFVHMDLDGQAPSITVRDNGSGMSIETIREGWLQIGTPLKRGSQIERTTRFGRLPLGEKGVGRLAAFKLGNRLEMFTRQAGGTEYQIVMDLENIFAADDKMRDSSLEDVRVWVRAMREPKHFSGNKSGTLIRINKLRPELDWPRREIRELRRMVNSLSSPFKEIGEFKAVLEVPGRQDEITDLMEIDSILDRAVWSYRFKLSAKSLFEWEYRFNPPDVLRGLKTRELRSAEAERLEYEPYEPDDDMPSRPPRDRLFAPPEDFKGIGPMEGRIYVYDLRSEVLKHLGGTKLVKMVLQNQGGIRVYRDGVRVFNYGEPGDDWLELNIKRVNKPGRTLATNSVLSAIHLTMDQSQGLREKTNREGFDENEAYNRFRKIVQSVIEHFNTKRQPDREALDSILKGDPIREGGPERLRKSVDEILEIARKKGIIDQISKPIERVRKEYETLQEVVVSSGAGLNIAIVFHEVEREARAIASGLSRGDKPETLKLRAEHLVVILDAFGNLLRKANRKTMPVSTLIKRAMQLNIGRFAAHKIIFSAPVLTGEDKDFDISGAFNFYLTTIMNLIDNAIYWVRRKAELEGGRSKRAIQIRTLPDWAAEGPSLAVLDSGPGFSVNPYEAMRPFASTRPGGMGLGLYLASTAMEANGGDLLIPGDIEDLDTDAKLHGAAVIMRFRRIR